MKFMKLGSRPDSFYTTESVRSVSSDVSSDLIVQVKGTRYLLHKFPLLSKSLRLQRLCAEIADPSHHKILQLPDFPGGVEAFELCAKFCYGITVTLSAHNLVSSRCAAEYLQMTEDVDKGNLIFKIETFFTSCILTGWRDSLVALQTTKPFPLWSENLSITSRCINSIASKISSNPAKSSQKKKHWWAEDLSELGIDLYCRTMVAVKSGGKMKIPPSTIGDALKIYVSRWLPEISNRAETDAEKHRLLLDSIVTLLPTERGVSCGFLLKLLKAGNLLKASSSTKTELARRAGLQLEEASVGDLLIPAAEGDTVYDVDVVISMLDQYMGEGEFGRRRSRSAEDMDMMMFEERRRSSSVSHVKVAKIVDGYLQKVASDRNLGVGKFVAIAEAIPEAARVDHDDLYKAIDVYLKGHPELNKTERKRICRLLDCRKLSVEVCMHAARNEMLPLRVVVQVLFFEHARNDIKALLGVHKNQSKVCSTADGGAVEERWSVSSPKPTVNEEEDEEKYSKVKGFCSMTPNRSKGMFCRLWPIHRSGSEKK